MTDSRPDPSPLARALGRIPCGLFLATVETPDGPVGFVASFVQQVGFEPPTVALAVGKARGPLEALRSSGRFALSVLDKPSSGIMGGFFKPLPEGQTPFDGHELHRTGSGSTVFASALAWLDCTVSGEHETGDHVVVFGVVTEGVLQREGDPSVHLRSNGLGY
ncbi:MAG: flavin reductase family protein [Planctomycetes bacterium]|nr:flavin reductase family protein [Planctomycetota bacterium]